MEHDIGMGGSKTCTALLPSKSKDKAADCVSCFLGLSKLDFSNTLQSADKYQLGTKPVVLHT